MPDGELVEPVVRRISRGDSRLVFLLSQGDILFRNLLLATLVDFLLLHERIDTKECSAVISLRNEGNVVVEKELLQLQRRG